MSALGGYDPKRSHLSATGTKKQMIGSLQQNDDAARLEFVWQSVEMNDADTGDTVQNAFMQHAKLRGSDNKEQRRLRSSLSLIWIVCAAVLVLSICKAPARDLGQWDGVDPLHRKWFNELMRPDVPALRCCGLADAYWAHSYEVKGHQYIAIITDTRDDISLGRRHIENGRRFAVPNTKIKWDRGNPTGHGIIFIGYGDDILCYVPPGGG